MNLHTYGQRNCTKPSGQALSDAHLKELCKHHSDVHVNNQSHVYISLKASDLTSKLAVSQEDALRTTQTSTYVRTYVRGNDRTANIYAYVHLYDTHTHTSTPNTNQLIHGTIPSLSFKCVSCFEVRHYDILIHIGLNK
jgi:hypothetical protein